MNKLQKLVCWIFRIKQNVEVQNITFNDPKKCENVCEMSGEEFSECMADIGNMANPKDKVVLGTAISIDSIRHVPLSESGKNHLGTRTIVIQITETEWD